MRPNRNNAVFSDCFDHDLAHLHVTDYLRLPKLVILWRSRLRNRVPGPGLMALSLLFPGPLTLSCCWGWWHLTVQDGNIKLLPPFSHSNQQEKGRIKIEVSLHLGNTSGWNLGTRPHLAARGGRKYISSRQPRTPRLSGFLPLRKEGRMDTGEKRRLFRWNVLIIPTCDSTPRWQGTVTVTWVVGIVSMAGPTISCLFCGYWSYTGILLGSERTLLKITYFNYKISQTHREVWHPFSTT